MKNLLMIPTMMIMMMMVAAGLWAPARAGSAADEAFKRLQGLAGQWDGKAEDGATVHTGFQVVAGNTAVLETLKHAEMEEMITLYSEDGDGIALQHYCPTNNQPRMRARPQSGQTKRLVFEFQGAGNLPDAGTGHQHKLVIEFEDATHITERWTWRANGKDALMVFHLTRKKK
jgi:hypothetical protein